jgi:hypothetical protein
MEIGVVQGRGRLTFGMKQQSDEVGSVGCGVTTYNLLHLYL